MLVLSSVDSKRAYAWREGQVSVEGKVVKFAYFYNKESYRCVNDYS